MNEQLKIKPVLDTSILQKQLDMEAPRLKLNIDTSHFSEQIQSAVGNLNIQPIQVPVRLSVSEKELQGAVTPALNALSLGSQYGGRIPLPTAGNPQSIVNNTSSSDTGFLKGMVKTGNEAVGTYNSLAAILGTVTGLMDGSLVNNFSKSFD